MPVQTTALIKQVEDVVKPHNNNNAKPNIKIPQQQTQTPPPAARKKTAKSERASLLCSTPPTCIKDKDCHVEYTRREFLGEVNSLKQVRRLIVGGICSVLSCYESTESSVCGKSRRKSISQNSQSKGESIQLHTNPELMEVNRRNKSASISATSQHCPLSRMFRR